MPDQFPPRCSVCNKPIFRRKCGLCYACRRRQDYQRRKAVKFAAKLEDK